MFLKGPTWRIEQVPIEWVHTCSEPIDSPSKKRGYNFRLTAPAEWPSKRRR